MRYFQKIVLILALATVLGFSECGSSSHYDTSQNSEISQDSDTPSVSEFIDVFYDDFTSLNENIWQVAQWNNGKPFYNAWCKEQIGFKDGVLTLTLEKKDCHSETHASGEYRTHANYKYGKYTARFKASDITGTISSFFIYTGSHEGSQWDEIDFEILGKDSTKIQLNYWRDSHEHPITYELGFDASLSMHTYSFIWHPEYIEWYIDEKLIRSVTENHNNDKNSLPVNAGKIMLNLWAAQGIDNWSGVYQDATVANSSYDFVKYEIFKQ